MEGATGLDWVHVCFPKSPEFTAQARCESGLPLQLLNDISTFSVLHAMDHRGTREYPIGNFPVPSPLWGEAGDPDPLFQEVAAQMPLSFAGWS